jgi:hypothetical protein
MEVYTTALAQISVVAVGPCATVPTGFAPDAGFAFEPAPQFRAAWQLGFALRSHSPKKHN